MVIVCRSRLQLDQVLFYLQIGLLAATILMLAVISFPSVKDLELQTSSNVKRSMPIEKILTGALSLKENTSPPLALALEQKLVFLSQSLRPDLKQEDRVFRIGVKGAESQSIIVKEGQPIFCHLTQHASGGIEAIEFSEGGDTKMIPHVLDAKSLLLNVQQTDGSEMEVILKASGSSIIAKKIGSPALHLQSAKWLGTDLFFKEYGGENYQPLGQKQKIEISSGKDRYVLYVKEKDFLTFEGGKWRVVETLEEADRENPLAKIAAISSGQLDIEAWDEKGFPLFYSSLSLENPSLTRFIADQVFQEAKLRTSRQVSCKIGKKRFLLQQGDWLLKTGGTWHKLLSLTEIENFLNHETKGDLCVIDQIDSKGMVKGHYFNEMRTEIQPFSFRAASSKANKKGKRP